MVSDVFDTSDGSSLDADCTREYTSNAASKTDAMIPLVTEAIQNLCEGDIANVLTYTSTFLSLGQQASNIQPP